MSIKFKKLNKTIIKCRKCPRLVKFIQKISTNKRKQNENEIYWGKPVPGFGDENSKYKIAVLDLGVKMNILKNLSKRNAYMKVFPHNSKYEDMKKWNPDAYFISNGPGDPEPLSNAINVTKEILNSKKPLFGICLGHQVIALANGIKTYKMHN